MALYGHASRHRLQESNSRGGSFVDTSRLCSHALLPNGDYFSVREGRDVVTQAASDTLLRRTW